MLTKLYSGGHVHNLVDVPTGEAYNAWNKSIEKVLEDMHSGKLLAQDLNFDLFNYYKDTMLKGIGKGFKTNFDKVDYDTSDYALLTKMKSNLYGFAGAKTYSHLKELNEHLYDANGKLVPFKDFKDKATATYRAIGVTETKYQNWLQVEYDTAIAQGTIARQWVGWMENIDIFPNLRYRTVGDGHVRPEHAKLNGIVVAKGSVYCDAIIPIKDFGCRCGMDETKEPVTDNPPPFEHDGPFEGNVGKTGNVISKKHPYYPQSKKDREAVQNQVDDWAKQEYIGQQKAIYEQYKNDNNYALQHFNNNTGGYVVRHNKADNYNLTETKVINNLVNNGQGIVQPAKSLAKFSSTHDILINEVPFEIKAVTGNVKRQSEQRIKEAMHQAGNVVLFFDSKISIAELQRGLGNVKANRRLNTILVMVNDAMAVITKKEIIAGDFTALNVLK